jgi:hypothetical protein
MWTLTPTDMQCAKEELLQRRTAAEARHAEELKAIDAELERIAEMEQAIDIFARKHMTPALPDKQEPAPKIMTKNKPVPSSKNWGDALFTPAAAAQEDAA